MPRIITHMEMEQVSQVLKQELIITLIAIYRGVIRIRSMIIVTLVLMLGIKVVG